NSVLERHALLVDTIVMVERHQLPKRHNETKLRKKILSMYIQGKITSIHACRIKNQHQPISKSQRDKRQSLPLDTVHRSMGNMETQSMLSFSYQSQKNVDTASISQNQTPTRSSFNQ
ncbi:hypothetical protein CU098_009039, partial [Rhizopus stolonifer]